MAIVNGCIHIFIFFRCSHIVDSFFCCMFTPSQRCGTKHHTIMKSEITPTQKSYLVSLKKELKNLEILGKSNSTEWWSIVESIDAVENNF